MKSRVVIAAWADDSNTP